MNMSYKKSQVILEDTSCSQTKDEPKENFSQNELLTDSIVQISAQLTKIQINTPTDENKLRVKMDILIKLYISLVNILREKPEIIQWHTIAEKEVDLLGPLIKLISFNILQDDEENEKVLVGLFASLIWFFLSNDNFHTTFKKTIYNYCGSLHEDLAPIFTNIRNEPLFVGIVSNWNIQMLLRRVSDVSQIPSIIDMSHTYNVSFLHFFWKNFLAFSNMLEDLTNYLDPKKNQFTRNQNNNLFKLLEQTLSLFESPNESELICLLIMRDKDLLSRLETHQSSSNKNVSTINKNCISKILEQISNIAVLNPYILGSSGYLLKQTNNEDLLRFSNFTNKRQRTINSFRFILEALDQNIRINYLTSSNLANYLLLSLNQIDRFTFDKLELYSTYNGLKSKLSLLSMTLNLNLVLSLNLLNLFDELDVPNLIFANFSHLNLPPLPKSNSYFQNHKKKDQFNNDCTVAYNKENFNKILESLLLNLKLLNYCFKDEINSLECMNTNCSKSIPQKILLKVIDSIFSTLFTTLMFIERYDNNILTVEIVTNMIYKIILGLLNLNLPLSGNFLVWISLVNFANDVCFYSVSNVPIFSSLFKYLIQNDTAALDDPLVKSGLEYFISTFIKNESNFEVSLSSFNASLGSLSSSFAEISLDEYNFLYSNNDNNGNHNTSNNSIAETERSSNSASFNSQNPINVSTPLRVRYNQYPARQQSTHVDNYKS